MWEEVKEMFLKRFCPIHDGDLYVHWAALRQTGTAEEYIKRFIELSAPLEGVTERVALGNFLDGLQDDIKIELRLWTPTDLGRAIDLAQQIEERNESLFASRLGSLGKRSPQTSRRIISRNPTHALTFSQPEKKKQRVTRAHNILSQRLKYKTNRVVRSSTVTMNNGLKVMCADHKSM